MEVGLAFGLVIIMGKLYQQLGLAMGSGLAAGAATLYASWTEDAFLKTLSLHTLAEFRRLFLIMRWQDDRWILVVARLPAEMVVILKEFLKRNFF